MRTRATLIGSLAIALSLSGRGPSAQAISPQSIEDQVLGWKKIYDDKGATLPIKVDQRVYSPAQLSIAQSFANWVRASYLPTGALGDVRQIVSEKLHRGGLLWGWQARTGRKRQPITGLFQRRR